MNKNYKPWRVIMIPGNIVRFILYKQVQQHTDDQGRTLKVRVKRSRVPNFIIKFWERRFESKSINVRTVSRADSVTPLYTQKRNVPENSQTEHFARLNKHTITEYLQKEQQEYLKQFPHWQNIREEDKNNPGVQGMLQERTREIATWLVSSNTYEFPPDVHLSQLLGNREKYASQLVSKEMLHEATNIALRTMLKGEQLNAERPLSVNDFNPVYENKLFPDSIQFQDYLATLSEAEQAYSEGGFLADPALRDAKNPFFAKTRASYLKRWDDIYSVADD